MISGMDYWNEDIKKEMQWMQIGGRHVLTFKNMPDNLYEALRDSTKKYPEKIAIIDNWGCMYSYREFLHKTDLFAEYLNREKGVKAQSRVALLLHNSMEFCVAFLALSKLGAVSIPLPSKFTKEEICFLTGKITLQGIICEEHVQKWFEKKESLFVLAVADMKAGYGLASYTVRESKVTVSSGKPEDAAIIMFTSGTTTRSKGVVLKNYQIMHAILAYQRILKITQEDKSVIPVPIYHITGLVALLGLFLYSGGCIYLQLQFDAERVLKCVTESDITFLHSSPTVFLMLLAQKEKFQALPSLRAMACGSSNMPVEKIKELHRWLPHMSFHTVYGLTETTSPATIFETDAATHPYCGSCGRPIPGTQFAIWNEQGVEVSWNELGEVMVRGSVVLEEYLDLKTELLTKDGWLHTGDMGYFNEEGYLYIADRKKDMINYGGEKVFSFDVENAIYELDGVGENAVAAVKDPIYGEVAGAVIVRKSGYHLTEEQVKDFLKGKIAKYKIPRKIIFLNEIPKTLNGKIDKNHVRELLNEEVLNEEIMECRKY